MASPNAGRRAVDRRQNPVAGGGGKIIESQGRAPRHLGCLRRPAASPLSATYMATYRHRLEAFSSAPTETTSSTLVHDPPARPIGHREA